MNSKLLLYNFYRTDTTYDWSLPTHSQLKQTILTFEDKIVRLIGPHAALSDSGFLFHLLNILESLSILVDKVEKPKMRLSVASSLMCKRWKPRTERRAGSASPSLSIWIKGARAWGQTDRQPADPSSADTQGSFGGGVESRLNRWNHWQLMIRKRLHPFFPFYDNEPHPTGGSVYYYTTVWPQECVKIWSESQFWLIG